MFLVLFFILCVSDTLIVPNNPQNQFKSLTKEVIKPLSSVLPLLITSAASKANAKQSFEYQPALQGLDYGKPRTIYPDFKQMESSGLQYKPVKEGEGKTASPGDRVVVDWEGYTIGYYGRPFQTRNKVKGGAFDSTETEFFRWVVGSGSVVAALGEYIVCVCLCMFVYVCVYLCVYVVGAPRITRNTVITS